MTFLAICFFIVFRNSIFYVGFGEVYNFRFLFKPLGYLNNVWAELSLFFLGCSFLARKFSWGICFLSIMSILFTFSRSAYIAFFFFMFFFFLFVKYKKEKIKLIVCLLLNFIIIASFCSKELQMIVGINKTASQQRSTEWRIETTKALFPIISQQLLFGYGKDSYSFVSDQKQSNENFSNFTNIAPNLPIFLLMENGLVGLLSFFVFVILICLFVAKHNESGKNKLIAITLLAILIKELSQANLFIVPQLYVFMILLLAYLQRNGNIRKQMNSFNCCLCQCYLLFSLIICKMWKGGTFSNLFNIAILCTIRYQHTGYSIDASRALDALQRVSKCQPKDKNLQFLMAYIELKQKEYSLAITRIKACNMDPIIQFVYGETLIKQGNKRKGERLIVQAVLQKPILLRTQDFAIIRKCDLALYGCLKDALLEKIRKKTNSPFDNANCGALLFYMDEKKLAKQYLSRAIQDLPNLSTPWRLLGDNNKANLIEYGAFSLSNKRKNKVTVFSLFYKEYAKRIQDWYCWSMK